MKQVKDPIYGYLEFEELLWTELIDLPEFQRLRHVSQTGYRALFPSAHHNRFVHSLGVAHLGKLGFDSFRRNVEHIDGVAPPWDALRTTFLLACLLHDVGHSPFSHTGERFYEDAVGEERIAQELIEAVPSGSFAEDLGKGAYGKPHEAMSAIVGLDLCRKSGLDLRESFSGEDGNFDPELFVRAIIGLKYRSGHAVENALIELLNGKFIDVDKLDYIMRDAHTTGYGSLLIDYERLLSGYTLVAGRDGRLTAGFGRKSLSVIENVIYAKDLERKWIQLDPTILYDGRVVEYLIEEYAAYSKERFAPDGVFVKAALTREGLVPEDRSRQDRVRLLCDDDVVAYAKNVSTSEAAAQFFSRADRLKPLWKSELEYRKYASDHLTVPQQRAWTEAVGLVSTELSNRSLLSIDKDFMDILVEDIKFASDLPRKLSNLGAIDFSVVEGIKRRKELALELCRLLERFSESVELGGDGSLEFRFYLIECKGFKADYDFEKMENILVDVGSCGSVSLRDEIGAAKKIVRSDASDDKYCFLYTTSENKRLCPDLTKRFWQFLQHNLPSA